MLQNVDSFLSSVNFSFSREQNIFFSLSVVFETPVRPSEKFLISENEILWMLEFGKFVAHVRMARKVKAFV